MTKGLVTLVICYTLLQLQQAEFLGACRSYCINVERTDAGILVNEECYCKYKISKDRIESKKLSLPRRVKLNTHPESSVYKEYKND